MNPYETGGAAVSVSEKLNVPSGPVVRTVTGLGPDAQRGSVYRLTVTSVPPVSPDTAPVIVTV